MGNVQVQPPHISPVNSLMTAYQLVVVASTVSSNQNSICEPNKSKSGSGATTRCAYEYGLLGNEPTITGADSYLLPMRAVMLNPEYAGCSPFIVTLPLNTIAGNVGGTPGFCCACNPSGSRVSTAMMPMAIKAATAKTALHIRKGLMI